MSDVDLLTAQVELHPTNDIVASMLVNELMESRDMNRSEAGAHVVRVQEVAIDAAFMRRAAELLSGCPWQRAWARDTVLEQIVNLPVPCPVVMLIRGLQSPRLHMRPYEQVGTAWVQAIVTVGAQWLVMEYREYIAWRTAHNREVRELRRKK